MCGGQDGTVHYGKDVRLIVGKPVATHQQDEITYQQAGYQIRDVLMLHGQRNDGGGSIAKSQPLHDAQDTDAVERPDRSPKLFSEAEVFRGGSPVIAETGKPADGHADEEDDDGTPQYLHAGGVAELEVVLPQGNVRRDSHDKHEEGKDEVGGGQAVPFSMSQGGIDVSP